MVLAGGEVAAARVRAGNHYLPHSDVHLGLGQLNIGKIRYTHTILLSLVLQVS